jgi:glycosyltransferase involved in cell wall biosynthesis
MAKLLMIAPDCDRRAVGEAWVAYQWARGMFERHDMTLVTSHESGNAPVAEQFPGLRVIEWTEPRAFQRFGRFSSMLKPGYVPFYLKARRWIRAALASGERFDLAHQVEPVAMRYPCPAAGLGIPYVIGPVGGSLDSPKEFVKEEGTTPWYVGLRALDRFRLRRDPLLRATYEGASCVVGIAPYVISMLGAISPKRFEIMFETGIESLPEPVDRSTRVGPIRLLYVGRLIRTKGARDAIRAMELLRDLPVVLDIVGDGPDANACKSLASEIGVSERVVFHGRQSRNRVDEFYRAADVFVFPSYREPGGNVMWEAMGHGLPAIVSDRGGPGSAIDETCGIRLPVLDPRQLADDLARAIRELVEDSDRRLSLGEGARRRVADVALWPRKIDQMDRLYSLVLDTFGGQAVEG